MSNTWSNSRGQWFFRVVNGGFAGPFTDMLHMLTAKKQHDLDHRPVFRDLNADESWKREYGRKSQDK